MARTAIVGSEQGASATFVRANINTATPGSALITKLLAGANIIIQSYTGADSGTGDVTVGYRPSVTVISSNTTATANNAYAVEANNITITLPASPTIGQFVSVMVMAGYSGGIINPNSANIQATSGNMNINVSNARFTLVYIDATNGWCFA